MKRDEIWTLAGGPDYAGKPRPAIIIQSDKFDATRSVTVCPLTSLPVEAEYARFALAPSSANGLQIRSFVMIDKVITVPRQKIGYRIGQLDRKDARLLNRRLALFLGLSE